MPISRRPAIYIKKGRPIHPRLPIINRWTCDPAKLTLAKFQHRKQPHLTAVLHRSTKKAGMWQATFFDSGLPTGDFQAHNCDEALREFPPTSWRLKEVRPSAARRT